MASQWKPDIQYIKIEDTPSPEPSSFVPVDGDRNTSTQLNSVLATVMQTATIAIDATPAIDPRDPEGFLKRCAGFNKKTRVRCNSVIGKKSEQSCHPTFLPTCRAHREQQSFAGWCQYQRANGERCSRLFRWTPPYFELCSEHQGHPDTPCYFMSLPLELRHEVFRYLLPDRPIGSTTAPLHKVEIHPPSVPHVVSRLPPSRAEMARQRQNKKKYVGTFPMPLLNLYLVSRQFHQEIKDLLFSTTPFVIDVRKDGTFMCGRRLLEPRRADGSSHFLMDETDEAKQRFLKYFDWSAVKHYTVDILVENGANGAHSTWDEEVELYDIRDYISVVVSGVLAKSRNLCKLHVRLCLANFPWTHEQTLANTKLIVGPFESLRNVRQPQIQSIYMGIPIHNSMLSVQRIRSCSGSLAPICSVPPLPTQIPILVPGMPDFDAYASAWSRWISSPSSTALVPKAPIRSMFTAFKDFYSELSSYVPEVTYISGRRAFLHRARVAREQENVEAFRELRNEAIAYWSAYLDREERKKNAMDAKMGRMLDMDIYPSHEWDDVHATNDNNSSRKKAMPPPSKPGPSKSHAGNSNDSTITLSDADFDKKLKDCDEAVSRTRQMIEIMDEQHKSQPYDEQLRLLEAPNRKRLQMAQQERQRDQDQSMAQQHPPQVQQHDAHKEAQTQQQMQLRRRLAMQQQQQQQALTQMRENQHQAQRRHDNWQIRLGQEMSTGFDGNVPLESRGENIASPNTPTSTSTISPTTATYPSPPPIIAIPGAAVSSAYVYIDPTTFSSNSSFNSSSLSLENSNSVSNSVLNSNSHSNSHLNSTSNSNEMEIANSNAPTSPEYHIDEADIACYAHVNLSEEWYTEARNGGGAGPGPASAMAQKRRVDSGFSELDFVSPPPAVVVMETERDGRLELDGDGEVGYVGKGKGRMGGRDVICID